MISIIQSINESKCTDSYVEPLIKAMTEMLKEVDDQLIEIKEDMQLLNVFERLHRANIQSGLNNGPEYYDHILKNRRKAME